MKKVFDDEGLITVEATEKELTQLIQDLQRYLRNDWELQFRPFINFDGTTLEFRVKGEKEK